MIKPKPFGVCEHLRRFCLLMERKEIYKQATEIAGRYNKQITDIIKQYNQEIHDKFDNEFSDDFYYFDASENLTHVSPMFHVKEFTLKPPYYSDHIDEGIGSHYITKEYNGSMITEQVHIYRR